VADSGVWSVVVASNQVGDYMSVPLHVPAGAVGTFTVASMCESMFDSDLIPNPIVVQLVAAVTARCARNQETYQLASLQVVGTWAMASFVVSVYVVSFAASCLRKTRSRSCH
jgi:hypothetical protein